MKLQIPKQLTKASISQVSDILINKAIEGIDDPLELALKIDYMTKVLEDAKKKLMFATRFIFEDKGNIKGVPYHKAESGVRYNFASNREWFALQQKINELKEQMKPIEESMKEALKQYDKGNHVVDKDTGEVGAMATKTSKTIIKFDYKN